MPKHIYDTPQVLAQDLASNIIKDLKPKETLILPGGSSPKLLIKELLTFDTDLSEIQITTTDERVVEIHDPNSNIGQILNIFKKRDVSNNLIWLCDDKAKKRLPITPDITVIGFGLDGHFASLFPENDWRRNDEMLFEASAPFEPKERLSLSYNYLLSSKIIHVLVPGTEKLNLIETGSPKLPIKKLIEEAGEKLHLHICE